MYSFNKTSKFQILRLGPVDTDFTKGVIHDGGLLKKIIFKIVVLESTDCAKLIHFYAQTNKEIVNIPIRSLVIYIILKWLRLFFTPHKSFLYKN